MGISVPQVVRADDIRKYTLPAPAATGGATGAAVLIPGCVKVGHVINIEISGATLYQCHWTRANAALPNTLTVVIYYWSTTWVVLPTTDLSALIMTITYLPGPLE